MFFNLAFLLVLGLAFEKVYADEPERIVGGDDASPGEFPYMASLREGYLHVCGGTIVTNSHIITAAHCIDEYAAAPWDDMSIVTGSVDLYVGGQTHRIKDIRVHPNYKEGAAHSWANDIAVITLEQPMQFNEYQKPIPLATIEPPVNAPLTMTGWGRLSTHGRYPTHLQKFTHYYINNQQCKNSFVSMAIYKTHVCAFHSYGAGACVGDSGGPLVHQGRLLGIVSWSISCAAGRPDVFTRVSEYIGFINDVLRG